MQKRGKRVVKEFAGSGRTHQSFRDECNINNIMSRFEKTGIIEHTAKHQGYYGDLTQGPQDFRQALEMVREANNAFMELPSRVRKEFENSAAEFLDCVEAARRNEVKALKRLEGVGLLESVVKRNREAGAGGAPEGTEGAGEVKKAEEAKSAEGAPGAS